MNPKLLLIPALIFASFSQSTHAAALLLDTFGGSNPSNSSDWVNAGVTEDLTGAAGGVLHDNVYHISNLTQTVSPHSGYSATTFPGNTMLNGYWYTNDGAITTVSLGGFQTGGIANTMVTSGLPAGNLNGNSFTIAADHVYKLYLFGAGDNNGQNATFTFGGVNKTTNTNIVGTAANNNHFVTYEFTTPTDLTGFTLAFSYVNPSSSATFNGLALVAIPEPSSSAMALGAVALAAFIRRRRTA